MRRFRPLAIVLGGSPLIALLLAPLAQAQQPAPPPGLPVSPAPAPAPGQVISPAPGQVVDPVPGQVIRPAPAPAPAPAPVTVSPETPEEQQRQDRELAGSLRDELEPAQARPSSVTISLPRGWVRFAVDLDGDGTFDAVETIHIDDLNQARAISAERQKRMSSARGGQPEGMPDEGDRGQGPEEIEISGTVREIREFELAGSGSPHQIARVETDRGIAKVHFGPADSLQDMGIDEGDEVTVVGYRGMINDRPVLMARSVSKGDDSRDVESPDDSMLKRIRGEVIGTRTVVFRGHDEDHLVTEIELRSGNRAEVILGPKSKLDGLELLEGDMISLLVRPAMLNGQPAMAAEQIHFGDEAIAVNDPVTEPVRTEVDPLDAAEGESDSDDPGAGAEESDDAPGLGLDPDAPSLDDPDASDD